MFRLRDYQQFLAENRASIEAFRSRRQAAFEPNARNGPARQARGGHFATPRRTEPIEVPHGTELVEAPLGGNIWKIHVSPGRHRKGRRHRGHRGHEDGMQVPSPATGIVRAVYIQERQPISPGTPIIALEPMRQ